ncbi:MAG: AI-2E family transporter [Oscillospiraceae bacterium]|nr:AI-2E family transporter [Oscillospiraceae bacterium]
MRFKWDKKYLYWGVTAFGVIAACFIAYSLTVKIAVVAGLVRRILAIFAPVVYGLVIAFLFNGPVKFFEKHLFSSEPSPFKQRVSAFFVRIKSKLRKKNSGAAALATGAAAVTVVQTDLPPVGDAAAANADAAEQPVPAKTAEQPVLSVNAGAQKRRAVVKKIYRAIVPRDKKKKERKIARALSILLVVVLFLLLITGFFLLVIPRVYRSLELLAKSLPENINRAIVWINQVIKDNQDLREALESYLGDLQAYASGLITEITKLINIEAVAKQLAASVVSVVSFIFNLVVGVIAAVYSLYNKEHFISIVKKIIDAFAGQKTSLRIKTFLKSANVVCSKYITAQLFDALIVGIVSAIGLSIMRVPYAVLIAVILAVTNIIPVFGPFLGAIPSALLVLLNDPKKCIVFIIFVLIIQQIDGNIINPRIHGQSSGLSGFWVLFAVLLFGGLFGFWGFVIAVPCFTLFYRGFASYVNGRIRRKAEAAGK